ncbi:hypothetical protein BOTBODRAFT_51651 [Botryobasidium botryosum FD-172 SS1]|uniref:F-box domain-containing protein n=1 Tax=Botryobasidium botryosum (strain FD-172 SS1) TaxID=930990 RepID=A0A067N9C0_BOTB1|nr:hypothetical protein BOTBODRAFT_51651 [Botryobasidium botryosum FD-172 SS1]
MLSIVPPEVVLHIFSFIPIYDIPALRCLNSAWKQFVELHENTIYRSAAILHSIAMPGSSLERSKDGHVLPWLDGVTEWKALCQKYAASERAWTGQAAVSQKIVDADSFTHRFKIDEEQRTIICTNLLGGLRVVCAQEKSVLWSLPALYVRRCAHIEFSRGFIVFDRHGADLEVWQRETDYEPATLSPIPDASQLRIWGGYPDQPAARGHYRPFAMLSNPSDICAYRLAYPHLLVASHSAGEAYIWEIPTATLVQTLHLPPSEGATPPTIDYVDISDTHVFLGLSVGLVVYSRLTGSVVLEISTYKSSILVDRVLSQVLRLGKTLPNSNTAFPTLKSHPLVPASGMTVNRTLIGGFAAVHISPSGRDLVALTHLGLLLYIPAFSEAANLEDRIHTMFLGSRAIYMAYDGKRVVVCTVTGVYCITLDGSFSAPVPLLPPKPASHSFPAPSVQRVAFFANKEALPAVTCLQLTPTALWLTWINDDSNSATWDLRYVDFSN